MTEHYYVPTEDSQGGHYHKTECGAHLNREVTKKELLKILKHRDLKPCGNCIRLQDMVPVAVPPEHGDYRSVNAGGCWICHTDVGDMSFDTEFDTYYHERCLPEDYDTILEYERRDI